MALYRIPPTCDVIIRSKLFAVNLRSAISRKRCGMDASFQWTSYSKSMVLYRMPPSDLTYDVIIRSKPLPVKL